MKKIFVSFISVILTLSIMCSAFGFFPASSKYLSATAASTTPDIQVQAHVQNKGWLGVVSSGKTAGTTGQGLRLEDLKIRVTNCSGGVKISTHQSNVGWVSYTSANSNNWAESGSTGKSRAIEAVKIQLFGAIASSYDVEYRVHSANIGWGSWVKNNKVAGTEGRSLQAEAIQVRLVKKNTIIDKIVEIVTPSLTYRTHIQNVGTTSYVKEGNTAGSVGKGLRMEGLWIKLNGGDGKSGVTYRTHVSDVGWQDWKSSDQMAGTTGKSKAIECVQIKLNSNLSSKYDIYYRVHVEDFGWLGWAVNGSSAGTTGGGYRVEGIQIKLVKKGEPFGRGGAAYKDMTNSVVVTAANINNVAEENGIGFNTCAYAALKSINSKYYSALSSKMDEPLIFFFEGVGNDSSSSKRMNAMCVVVKNKQIVYLNRNSSTIPDDPFDPSKNEKKAMPTLKSGIYSFTTTNHHKTYAALNISNAKVVRHSSKSSNGTEGTSDSINIHRRSSNSIYNSTVNSAGCLIVGSTPSNIASSTCEYARFIQAVGIVDANGSADQKMKNNIKGTVIVDRTYAFSYLKSIGYSDRSISMIG